MASPNREKYIVCNAVDADPRSLSARARSTRDAEAVVNGLLSAGQTFGATRAYFCVDAADAEQAVAVKAAIAKVGDGIDIQIALVDASLVLQDESALLRVLEGRQAIPHVDTSSAATLTLWGDPVAVYGVEALARLAEGGSDTRMLTVWWEGAPQVVEVPSSTTLRAVARDVMGAEPDSERVKAVRFGGTTGRFYAGRELDLPIGSEGERLCGVIEIIPAETCTVELVRDTMRYLSEQSCGACVACRECTRQLADMLEEIAAFQAEPGDTGLMEELAEALEAGSICDVGKYAATSLRSSLEFFPEDYRAHLEDKRCPGDQGHA